MATLDSLLAVVKQLSVTQQRKVASIVGAIVADAAVTPLQWMYKVDQLKEVVGDKDPIFFPESHCPFFKLPVGHNSCHGDHAFVILKSVVEAKGWDVSDAADKVYKYYGPGTDYEKATQEAAKKQFPISGPWANGVVKKFVAKYAAKEKPYGDPDNNDMDGLISAIPVMVLFAGKPEMKDKVTETVKIIQLSQGAISRSEAAAKILENLILEKGGVDEVLKELAGTSVGPEIREVVEAKNTPHGEAVQKFGLTCGMPGSFKGSLHTVYTAAGYADGIRTGIAGGDICSRSSFAGACLGAKFGINAIPKDWIEKSSQGVATLQLAIDLAKM